MIDILTMQFMQRAILAGILVGFLGSYYGIFIVQRKMSFLGSGLAHAAFGGVALGLLLKTEPMYIAIPFTILASILITYLKENTKLAADTLIGIIFSVSMALGVIFLSLKEDYSSDAFTYLFGSILAVSWFDIIIASILTMITIIVNIKFWGRWSYASFDEELARTCKQNIIFDNYLLGILISITIVVSIKLVGIVLIAAYLIIPAASARLIVSTFRSMTIIAILFGTISSLLGLIFSYLIDIPSGATIILIQAFIFLSCLLFNKNE